MEMKDESASRTQNFVVARYRDGRMIKGVTHDFGTQKKSFHIIPAQEGKSTLRQARPESRASGNSPSTDSGLTVSRGTQGEQERGLEVFLSELKAVFFVKSLLGKKGPHLSESAPSSKMEQASPKRVKITFFDEETLEGATHGYTPEREGFFIVPLEKETNNLRIFVVSKSVKAIDTWK
jgi:hypothetical protein